MRFKQEQKWLILLFNTQESVTNQKVKISGSLKTN